MASGKITLKAVKSASPGDKDFYLWDTDLHGFGLKVTPKGSLSYVFQYRMGGRGTKTRRMTIGKHGSPWAPASAREEAERLAIMTRQGIDPLQAKRDMETTNLNLAFSSYVERFVEGCLNIEWQATAKDVAASLRSNVVAIWKDKPLPSISKRDVKTLLAGMRGQPAKARRVYAILNRLFNWAVENDDLTENVMASMKPPSKPVARDRFLDDDELLRVWRSIATFPYPFGPFFKQLILTGQRRDEVAGMAWQELNRAQQEWLVPAGRSKNGVANLVHLTGLMIHELDQIAGSGTWPRRGLVFTTTGATPISGFSRAKRRLDNTISKDEVGTHLEPWRLHDIRRTVATGLQRLGVRFEVTEAVLNHVGSSKSGVAGIYQKHDWKSEKRAALEAWSTHISDLIEGVDTDNVVALDPIQMTAKSRQAHRG